MNGQRSPTDAGGYMSKLRNNEPALAMCWYDEVQWNILKQLQPDALDDTYETWRRDANRALQDMIQAGHNIRKVSLKIDVFLRWCEERDVTPDADSRAAYAAWKLQQRSR
jgi:hypothetical protein